MTDPERARQLIARADRLKSDRSSWDGFWQQLADTVMPRKNTVTRTTLNGPDNTSPTLFDNTAILANQILANGQLSWMTPHESSWFSFDAPEEVSQSDEAEQWYRQCTEIAQSAIAQSNFYSQIHELYLDRGCFGTAAIFCDAGRSSPLYFRTWNIGSYALAEDHEGAVDTCFREFKLTLRQAEQQFGRENLPEEMQKALKDNRKDQEDEFIHGIYPRTEYDPKKADGPNMPIASCYIARKGAKIVRESGYLEKPFMATRYLTSGGNVYGWSPSWMAFPEICQLNFLEKQLDALAELQVNPRLLIPDTHEGEVDIRAGGVTYYDSNNAAVPKEWASEGRYDVGLDRGNRKRQAINDAFHVDLFKMFSNLDKQMTAREVAERSSEKLIQFSPTFARMTTELFNPLLQRVFALLLRGGQFPQPPQSVIVVDPNAGEAFLPTPKVSYSSRIALAIKSLQNSAFARSMELLMPVATLRPDLLDNYDLDKIARDTSRNDGLPADWLQDSEVVGQLRQSRAEQAQQQAQMEQASMMADAAGKAGKIDPTSSVGKALEGALAA